MLSRCKRVIKVASNAELKNKHYYFRLWIAARNLGTSRRKWLDKIAEAFIADDFYVIYPSGEPYSIPLVDDVFGNDSDMRWLSYYFRSVEDEEKPKSYSRQLERVRLIDLYFRIAHPDIAAHFGR